MSWAKSRCMERSERSGRVAKVKKKGDALLEGTGSASSIHPSPNACSRDYCQMFEILAASGTQRQRSWVEPALTYASAVCMRRRRLLPPPPPTLSALQPPAPTPVPISRTSSSTATMKLQSVLATAILATSASARSSLFGSSIEVAPFDDALNVPGDNPLQHCQDPKDDILDLESVDLDPTHHCRKRCPASQAPSHS